jgi:Xaa-Pro aminopeptidase
MDSAPLAPVLLNRAQADRVLAKHGLDGLVAAQPINVYYLSSYWGVLMGVGRDPLYFAVLPRNDANPAALVMGSFEMRRLVTEGGTWMPNLVGYTAPLDAEHAADGAGAPVLDGSGAAAAQAGRTPGAAPYVGWPVRAGAMLSATERAWLDIQDRLRGTEAASAILGIVRAVREAGLERGTIGIDDLRLERWLRAAGLEHATFVHAEHVFCEIRRVKSPAEIDLLRTAARLNEIACLEAAAQIHDGAEWHEVENHYMAELASRGGRGCYLSGGSGGLPHLRVRRGEPTMIDALGRYRQYVGDFGRTVVVGDPSAELLRRNAAMQRGWLEILETVRPGLRYRELAERCVAAIRRQGFPEFVLAVPHSIGLQHTDDPAPMTLAGPDYGDPVLEPGVVLNVDLPFIEIGWGALHLEDTLLVTQDGCEPLTSMQMDLLVSP